jgi:hypothetical protein
MLLMQGLLSWRHETRGRYLRVDRSNGGNTAALAAAVKIAMGRTGQ